MLITQYTDKSICCILCTGWPFKHDRFWQLVKHDLSTAQCTYCTVSFTNLTFHKVPEQHGHVYLIGFKLIRKYQKFKGHVHCTARICLKSHLVPYTSMNSYAGFQSEFHLPKTVLLPDVSQTSMEDHHLIISD